MASIVEIANTALIELGAVTISSLSETTAQAVAVNTVWEQSRRSVLRSHTWNFATKTEDLVALTTNPRKFRYDYGYPLPSDSLRLVRVLDDHDFKLEENTIYTNKDSCQIKYIADVPDTATWDSLFVDAMSAKVQSKIAMAVTRDRTKAEYSENLYQIRLIAAQAIDATEDIEDRIPEPETGLISGRF